MSLSGKERQRRYYLKNKERIIRRQHEYYKRYREQYPERVAEDRARSIKRTKEVRDLWGRSLGATYKDIELLDIKTILPNEGFNRLTLLSEIATHFQFDISAFDRNDHLCLFEVTTGLHKKVLQKFKITRALGAKLFMLHVSPKLGNQYYLTEISEPKNASLVPNQFVEKLSRNNEVWYK